MNGLNDAFEQKLVESMEHFEMPYVPSSWDKLEKQLNKGKSIDYTRWIAAAAALVLVTSGSLALYSHYFRINSALAGYRVARFESKVGAVPFDNGSTFKDNLLSDESINSISEINTRNHSVSAKPSTLAKTNYTNNSERDTPEKNTSGVSPSEQLTVSAERENKKSTALSVQASLDNACAGTEVDFQTKNGPQEGSYLWNFGDGDFSNKPNPKHKFNKPGVYDISLSVTNKKDGQITTTVMNDFITIHPSPSADFEWEFVNNALEEPTVKIVNVSENASNYQWKFEDGSKSKEISPIRSYTDQGKQMIALEVSNEWGCSDSKIKYITINNDYNLMAPERFSASKETFMPEGLKHGKMSFKMTIYNGEKAIYETTNKMKGWDGKLPDGTMANQGKQYPWVVIIYSDADNGEKYFSGTVTLNP